MALTEQLKEALKQNDMDAINALLDINNRQIVTESLAFAIEKNGDGAGVLEFLLRNGADAKGKNADGVPMIVLAARQTSVEYIESLLQSGADVDSTTNSGDTALTSIVQFSENNPNIDLCVDLLLSRGANVNHINNSKSNALDLAALSGRLASVVRMFDFGAVLTPESKALKNAAQGAYSEIVSFLLSRGAAVNGDAPDSDTPLMAAAIKGSAECVELLLNANADINVKTDFHCSALSFAAMKIDGDRTEEDYRCVELLLSRGAQFEMNDEIRQAIGDESADFLTKIAREFAAEQHQHVGAAAEGPSLASVDTEIVGENSSASGEDA